MSDEQNRLNEPEDKFAATDDDDVEAHRLSSRLSEPEDKFAATDDDDVEAHRLSSRLSEPEDKFAATDEDDADVEGHMLGHKPDAGKMSS